MKSWWRGQAEREVDYECGPTCLANTHRRDALGNLGPAQIELCVPCSRAAGESARCLVAATWPVRNHSRSLEAGLDRLLFRGLPRSLDLLWLYRNGCPESS